MAESTVFTLTFALDNAQFAGDEWERSMAVTTILREVREHMVNRPLVEDVIQRVTDENGNRIGYALIEKV